MPLTKITTSVELEGATDFTLKDNSSTADFLYVDQNGYVFAYLSSGNDVGELCVESSCSVSHQKSTVECQ